MSCIRMVRISTSSIRCYYSKTIVYKIISTDLNETPMICCNLPAVGVVAVLSQNILLRVQKNFISFFLSV